MSRLIWGMVIVVESAGAKVYNVDVTRIHKGPETQAIPARGLPVNTKQGHQ